MQWKWRLIPLLPLMTAIGVSGCATIPTGPSVMVLPGQGKSFEAFQVDDAVCRQWASGQVGTTTGQASQESALSSAAIGTLLGAGLGAVIGSAAGHVGTGAAIGAAGGAVGGTAVGLGSSQAAAGTVQSRYDMAYTQCMYAKGNQVPGVVAPARPSYPPPPPPPGSPPPPPPGSAPPPPPPPPR